MEVKETEKDFILEVSEETDEMLVHCGVCSTELTRHEEKKTSWSVPRCIFCEGDFFYRKFLLPLTLGRIIYNLKIDIKNNKKDHRAVYNALIGYMGCKRLSNANIIKRILFAWRLLLASIFYKGGEG